MIRSIIYFVMMLCMSFACKADSIYKLNDYIVEFNSSKYGIVDLMATSEDNLYVNGTIAALHSNGFSIVEVENNRIEFENGTDNTRTKASRMPFEKINIANNVWANSGRFTFFGLNPNVVGVLLAEIILLLVWISTKCSKYKYWMCIGIAPLLYLMYSTGSRCSFMILAIGIISLFYEHIRKMNWKTISIFAIFISAIGCYLFFMPSRRGGDSVRLDMINAFPSMFSSAQFGWGIGESGNAYAMWFTEKLPNIIPGSMISGHLTFMVENGWLFSFIYVIAWLFAFYCYRSDELTRSYVLLLFIANMLNPCNTIWCLALPICVMAIRFKYANTDMFTNDVLLMRSYAFSACIIIFLIIYGRIHNDITLSNGIVKIGNDSSICIIDDGKTFTGGYWWLSGLSLKKCHNDSKQSISWTSSANNIPITAKSIVVFGENQAQLLKRQYNENANMFKNVSKITIIGPDSKFNSNDFGNNIDFTVIVGSLDPNSIFYKNDDFSEIVAGSYKYIPNWFNKIQ